MTNGAGCTFSKCISVVAGLSCVSPPCGEMQHCRPGHMLSDGQSKLCGWNDVVWSCLTEMWKCSWEKKVNLLLHGVSGYLTHCNLFIGQVVWWKALTMYVCMYVCMNCMYEMSDGLYPSSNSLSYFYYFTGPCSEIFHFLYTKYTNVYVTFSGWMFVFNWRPDTH